MKKEILHLKYLKYIEKEELWLFEYLQMKFLGMFHLKSKIIHNIFQKQFSMYQSKKIFLKKI